MPKHEAVSDRSSVSRCQSLVWQDVAVVAGGQTLILSDDVWSQIARANALVRAIVRKGTRAYGVNTGIGALCNVVVDEGEQSALSHNIIMSHATGFGPWLGQPETRAMLAVAINNYAHGYSGLRVAVVQNLLTLLNRDIVPAVPRNGSAGYMTHMAHASLVLLGQGQAWYKGQLMPGGQALELASLAPLRLEAKEGLCLVAGTPCSTGLAAVALDRVRRLLAWADAVSAMSFECLLGRPDAFDPEALALRKSDGIQTVGERLRMRLAGSEILADTSQTNTQDGISIRAIAQVHGAVHDSFHSLGHVVDRELASVTDNPVVSGTEDSPVVRSQAHGVGAGLAHGLDSFAVALASLGAISERRIDRMVNPLVSGMPAFLAMADGPRSGLMIAQYAAVALVGENRRLAAPATLDGGITSGLQEDYLVHATAAALKLLDLTEKVQRIVAIEYLTACQAMDCRAMDGQTRAAAPGTAALFRQLRKVLPPYADDRPLADDMATAFTLIGRSEPASVNSP